MMAKSVRKRKKVLTIAIYSTPPLSGGALPRPSPLRRSGGYSPQSGGGGLGRGASPTAQTPTRWPGVAIEPLEGRLYFGNRVYFAEGE